MEAKDVVVFGNFNLDKLCLINITINRMLAESYAVGDVNIAIHSMCIKAGISGAVRV